MQSKFQKWISEHVARDELLWKGAFGDQVSFLRGPLCYAVAWGLKKLEDVEKIPDVIGTHRSKSIELPVVEYSRPDLGLRLVVRGNFHDYKLSVESERPIEADFTGLFDVDDSDYLSPTLFEGFPKDRIYGPYAKNHRKFSADIGTDHTLYTTVFLIMRALGAVK